MKTEQSVTCGFLTHSRPRVSSQKRNPRQRSRPILLYRAAWYGWSIRKGVVAVDVLVMAMKVFENLLGPGHDSTLSTMEMVGKVYKLRGPWNEAETLLVQVVEGYKELFSEGHPNTLDNMPNLVLTYKSQGRWKKAEKLGLRVIDMRKRVLGPEHPNKLSSIAELASTL